MARKIQVLLTCDFDDDDTPAVETVTFSYDGATYAFEACQDHLDEFNETMQRFVARARREGSAPRGGGGRANAATGHRPARNSLGDIREWARANGYKVSNRGRIPEEVRQAFAAAEH